MSLRTRLLLLVLFAAIAPAMVLILHSVHERDVEVRSARTRLASTAQRIAEDLNDAVRTTSQLQYALAAAPVLGSGDRAACSDFLAAALREYPQFTGLLTIRPDGQLFCDSLKSGRDLNLRDRHYFQEALVSSRPVVLEPVFGRLTGIAVLQVAHGVRDAAGATRFVLLASLNLEKFMEARSLRLPPDSTVLALIDPKGTLLTWHPHDAAMRGTSVAGSALHQLARGLEVSALEGDIAVRGVPRVWATATPPQYPLSGLAVLVGASRERLSAAADKNLRDTLAILAAVLIVAFIGALALAELGVRRHTARIIKATRRLSQGDFSARVGQPYPRGELGDVMAVLDATAEHIQQQSGEIRRLNEGLERRVAERTADLEAALLYRSQFLANMSHELRTPLNAVIGYAELIESTPVSDGASLQRHSKQVREAARDLLAMINDLLELARIASGAQPSRLEACEARTIVRDAIASAGAAAAAKGIRLAFEPGPEIECSADPRNMQRLLQHLLANAVKFTAEGGRVLLRVARETAPDGRQAVRFSVGDTGIGIAAGDMGRLFAPFVQLETGLARRFGGTGVGLALVKGLVELQGGRIAAESVPGEGSTFSVWLPLAGASPAPLPDTASVGAPG